jgi:hypothetical protein
MYMNTLKYKKYSPDIQVGAPMAHHHTESCTCFCILLFLRVSVRDPEVFIAESVVASMIPLRLLSGAYNIPKDKLLHRVPKGDPVKKSLDRGVNVKISDCICFFRFYFYNCRIIYRIVE